MQWRSAIARCGTAVVVASWVGVPSGQTTQLPLAPPRDSGQSVTAAYEGWFENPDGTFGLLVGYFNRNHKQILDIPIGPDNRIEPGGPDRGQPTHFLPRRQWGVFVITVPADFGDRQLTWMLVANGQTTEIPMSLSPLWEVSPLVDPAQGNTPPVLRFEADGAPQQGPPLGVSAELSTTWPDPVTLLVWASDDGQVDPNRKPLEGAPVRLVWSKYRGPAAVEFAEERPVVDEVDGRATTTATFGAPGEYVLRLQANDSSGERGGFQCCWTNAHVKVTVNPGARSR